MISLSQFSFHWSNQGSNHPTRQGKTCRWSGLLLMGTLALSLGTGCQKGGNKALEAEGHKGDLLTVAQARKLSTDDMIAAFSTYPKKDKEEFLCLNSGGQAASIIAYLVPSMRIVKYIPTSAPDSAAGFHFSEESQQLARQGAIDGQEVNWGDTHHPAFSETGGKYDGQFAFINDKANPRIFVVDLRDLETKQIINNPIFRSDHGGAFVTPNTEYVIEGSQYPSTVDHKYKPLEQGYFNKYYRGGVTFHKFDREKGRIDKDASFTLIAPPYVQDLSDAGKGESYGFSFTNSFCAERYVGGIEKNRPPYEAGCSTRDMDYMHVIDWKKAEKVVAEGKAIKVRGHNVISMELAIKEGLMFLVPEPKSPHGADVTPDGRYIVVAGKLDTHASIFDIRKIKALIKAKDFAGKDPYGLPILDYKKALHGQVQLGLGPLHTQFDAKKGIAYTSVYIDSVVVQWNFETLKVLDKQSVHYNIGHLVSMQGDTIDPRGRYVIALNKLAIDRFSNVGPLHPQNHQLISVSGEKMRLLYDMPLPMGEPHYTQCIDVKTLKPQDTYEPGTDPYTMQPSPHATEAGKERVVQSGSSVEVFGTLSRRGITPRRVDARQGQTVVFHLTNVETDPNATIAFFVSGLNAMNVFPAGKTATVRAQASQSGLFALKTRGVDNPFVSKGQGLLSVQPDSLAEAARQKNHAVARAATAQLASWQYAKEEVAKGPGEAEFNKYGCVACHQIGRETGGPDLTGVTTRREKEWMVKWIMDPEKYYTDPTVAPLIKRFGIKMPKQGVSEGDARKIVDYLDTLK